MKLQRMVRYNLLKLLRLKSEPHKIALGFTIGFIPNWYPTFGIGPIISVALAKLFRANIISAFVGGVSGTLIWPVLFFFNFKVGNALLHVGSHLTNINKDNIESINLFYYKTKTIGYEFLIGSIFNFVLFGLIMYLVIYVLFLKYRAISLNKLKKEKTHQER